MNATLKTACICGALILATEVSIAGSQIQNAPTEKLDWQTTPEGVAFAALVGDRFAEPYMAMVKLLAGLARPAFAKSASMYGVMITGSMVHSAVGSDPQEDIVLSEGSFYRIPKDLPHVSKCVSNTDCITFLYQDGKFDFLPVDNQDTQ